ncbi:hypothetical protein SELMODRAFT_415625 [Selaginella moellendorffii]|uniref:Uncharacterized protein n=1 Tax=Selaginella moellendorffii TaxID=88036 RepID=D8RWQ8_SELML|nr:hypothetical protein SELMODRAFT_415625 [Selaginella moellendorffii]
MMPMPSPSFPSHFVPVDVNGKLVYKRAEDLKVGESLWESSQITEISKVEKLGLYNPLTPSGSIMIVFFPCPRVMLRWNNGRRIPSDESDHNAAAGTTGNKEPSIKNARERAIDERSKGIADEMFRFNRIGTGFSIAALEIEVPRCTAHRSCYVQELALEKLSTLLLVLPDAKDYITLPLLQSLMHVAVTC